MTIDELINCVGMPYEQIDSNGKAFGCMMPVYLLYPEIPHYDWPPDNEFSKYVLDLLKKHGRQIIPEEIKPGDVVAFRMPFDYLHVSVYIGNDQVIHCTTDETMEMFRMSSIKKRITGIFRWEGGG